MLHTVYVKDNNLSLFLSIQSFRIPVAATLALKGYKFVENDIKIYIIHIF
jgi:hypothetical protein